jgi:U3 small nucleolar RNA-associated protein 22
VDTIALSSSLYRSTQFHGLLTSILEDVSPSDAILSPVEAILHELHSFLTSLPSVPPALPLEAASNLEKKGVKVDWPQPVPTQATQYKVGFKSPTPERLYLVGSFAGTKKTLVRSRDGKYCIDMVVEIPEVHRTNNQKFDRLF